MCEKGRETQREIEKGREGGRGREIEREREKVRGNVRKRKHE